MNETLIPLLEGLRKALIRIGLATVILAVAGYFLAGKVLLFLQQLAGVDLVAYGVSEPFFAYLQIALGVGGAAAIPYGLFVLLRILPPLYPVFSRKLFLIFWAAAVLLFAIGVLFCLKVTLPFGMQFLLSYQTQQLAALISVSKFVSFCFWFLFGFGIIFELPLFMILLGRLGLVDAKRLGAQRRYAILLLAVVAAILTPTPDIFNLMLMAAPLYLLFEVGLLGMRFWQKKRL